MTSRKDLDETSKNILRGHIKLFFSVRSHPLVGYTKPFKPSEAWQWILFEIATRDRVRRLKSGKGYRSIKCPAGGAVHSLRFIADQWGWSKTRVITFLDILKSDGSIDIIHVQQFTLIAVINWKKYRNEDIAVPENYKKDYKIEGQQRDSNSDSQVIDNKDTYKNKKDSNELENGPNYNNNTNYNSTVIIKALGKEGKKKNKLTKEEKLKILDGRARIFYEGLDEFKSKYQILMIQEFWNYWTEPNKSFTKLKFEMETTWDLKKRLVYWNSNEEKWYGKKEKRTAAEIKQSARDRLKRVFGINDKD